MIRRLLPLLLLAACAHPPHDAARAMRNVREALVAPQPRYLPDDVIFLVDGVAHTDSSFQALDLAPAEIDSMHVCYDVCTGPRLVVYTKRAAVQRAPE